MKRALLFTAFNRPQYFQEALNSWKNVRGLRNWDIFVSIEPNIFAEEQVDMVKAAFPDHPSLEIKINPVVYGVLHNPWVWLERLFIERNYDFVIRTEDDLVVSADILEYFSWASEEFQNNTKVGIVIANTFEKGSDDPSHFALVSKFDPLVFGTWQDRWEGLFGPTWDHDYSTYNGEPGNQAGWDWNIDTRLYPLHNLRSVQPKMSRVHNIGIHGIHATVENYETASTFSADHGSLDLKLVDG